MTLNLSCAAFKIRPITKNRYTQLKVEWSLVNHPIKLYSSHQYCSIFRSSCHHQSNSVFAFFTLLVGLLSTSKMKWQEALCICPSGVAVVTCNTQRTARSPRIWPWWSWLNWEKWAEVIRSMIALDGCLVPCVLAVRIEINDPTALSSNAKNLESAIVGGASLFKNRSTQRRILMSTSPLTCRKLRIGVFSSTVVLSTSTTIASVTAEQDLRDS